MHIVTFKVILKLKSFAQTKHTSINQIVNFWGIVCESLHEERKSHL